MNMCVKQSPGNLLITDSQRGNLVTNIGRSERMINFLHVFINSSTPLLQLHKCKNN